MALRHSYESLPQTFYTVRTSVHPVINFHILRIRQITDPFIRNHMRYRIFVTVVSALICSEAQRSIDCGSQCCGLCA